MAYTNDNANLHPVLSLASATGALATQTNTPANLQGTIEEKYRDMTIQLDSMAGRPYVQDSCDSLVLASPSSTQTGGYALPPYPYPGETRIRTRAFALLGWDGPPTTPAVLEAPTSMAELHRERQFQPYPKPRVRRAENINTEASSSTLTSPQIPSVGLPTTQPSGSMSEITADAETNQPSTEEDEAPEPKKTRVPNGQGRPRRHRLLAQATIPNLRYWAQMRKGLMFPPSLFEALSAAVEVIPTIREMVNEEPYLLVTKTIEKSVSHPADMERERRNTERQLYQELSKYYPRGQRPWARSTLLWEVVRDLEGHPDLQ